MPMSAPYGLLLETLVFNPDLLQLNVQEYLSCKPYISTKIYSKIQYLSLYYITVTLKIVCCLMHGYDSI
jgi:hypothetical protein